MAALSFVGELPANGIDRNGTGARSMGISGADVANPGDILGIMGRNPAGLARVEKTAATFGATAIYGDASFESNFHQETDLTRNFGVFPELGIAAALPGTKLRIGFSIIPEQTRLGEWRYRDAPGGLDGSTSFGLRDHTSEITAIRAALGIGYPVTDRLSIGASLGLVYERVHLNAPYIFQRQPVLAGFKTLMDLETDGFGWNGEIGLLYKLSDSLDLGLSYRSPTKLRSTGSARGNARAQLKSLGGGFSGLRSDFSYDADVRTELRQSVSAGLSWRANDRFRVNTQVDWMNWADAFDDLDIRLSNGNNADLNRILGSNRVRDLVPLRWKDTFVYRLGVEYSLRDDLLLRTGYSFGENPIPAGTTTPLNAAISEHTLSAGLGYLWNEHWQVDLGYQYDLPSTVQVGRSALRAGEYSNSRIRLDAHYLSLSATYRF